jgi:hypothetical protein
MRRRPVGQVSDKAQRPRSQNTYSATCCWRAVLVIVPTAVLAIAVLAFADHVVSDKLNGKVELGICGG